MTDSTRAHRGWLRSRGRRLAVAFQRGRHPARPGAGSAIRTLPRPPCSRSARRLALSTSGTAAGVVRRWGAVDRRAGALAAGTWRQGVGLVVPIGPGIVSRHCSMAPRAAVSVPSACSPKRLCHAAETGPQREIGPRAGRGSTALAGVGEVGQLVEDRDGAGGVVERAARDRCSGVILTRGFCSRPLADARFRVRARHRPRSPASRRDRHPGPGHGRETGHRVEAARMDPRGPGVGRGSRVRGV